MGEPINYNPYNTPMPYNPPFAPPPPYPPQVPTEPWCGPQRPPKGPFGKLANDGYLINYNGLSSQTADVIVDNVNRTIKVNVVPYILYGSWVYEQKQAARTWQIEHNLFGYPNITVIDDSGEVVWADIKYLDKQRIQIDFSEPVAGRALLG